MQKSESQNPEPRTSSPDPRPQPSDPGLRQFGRMSGGYFVPTVINNALPFLFLPILTRYLLPRDYANVSLFITYVAIATSLSAPALTAFMSNRFFDRPREHVARIVGCSFVVAGLFTVGLLGLVAVFAVAFPRLSGLSFTWLLMVPVTAFTYSLFQVTLGVVRNQKKVLVFGLHQVTNTLVNFLASVLFVAVLLAGWQGRVYGIIIANALSAAVSLWYLARNGFLSFNFDRKLTGEVARFALTLVLDSSYTVVACQLGFLLMQYYYGKELLGVYSVGYNIANAVLILAATLNLSLTPFLFEQLSVSTVVNRRYIVRMLYANILVVVLGAGLVWLAAGVILRLMTTPAYYPARQFVPALAAGLGFAGMTLFIKPVLIRFGQQGYVGLVAGANLALLLAASYAFSRWFGYMGIAYAFGLSTLLMLALLLARAQAVFRLPWLGALAAADRPGA